MECAIILLDGAGDRGEGASEEVQALQAQVAEYKEKLRQAVKKGKGIEAERQRLQEQVDGLLQDQTQVSMQTNHSAGSREQLKPIFNQVSPLMAVTFKAVTPFS
eukprot:scaffold85371_cov19-Prasinocladus_malaysianus.AAC.1